MNTERFEMRVSLDFLRLIDGWRKQQDTIPTRAEAIRILCEKAVKIKSRKSENTA